MHQENAGERSSQQRFWNARAQRAAALGDGSLSGTVTNEPRTVALRDRLELAHAERLWSLSRTARVLDLAAGAGRVALHVAPRVAHVTLIDLSEAQLALAAEQARRLGISNLSFVQGSLTDGGYGGPFDLITLFGACVYVSDEELARVVEHCHAALAPGGKLLLKEPVSTTGASIRDERVEGGVTYRALFRPREAYARAFAARFTCLYQSATCAHLIPWFMGGTEQALPVAHTLLSSRGRDRFVAGYVALDPWLRRVERALRGQRLLGRLLAEVPVVQDFYLLERRG